MNRSIEKATFFGTADITEIEVEYSQPLKGGREIFGGLVPFGQPWRLGANGNTTISASSDLEIDGRTLSKGKYALYAIPSVKSWKVIFYSEYRHWGLPQQWSAAKVALEVDVVTYTTAAATEALSIRVGQKNHFEGSLEIVWDQTCVSLPLMMTTQKTARVGADILMGGASVNDFYSSATFYYETVEDYPGALLRINMALQMSERKPYFYYRLKSLIEARLGDLRSAIESARQSLDGARAVGSDRYVTLNETSLSQWTSELQAHREGEESE